MTDFSPLAFVWEGDGFKPATTYTGKRCDERYVIGQKYLLTEHNERSANSHSQQFAWLKEAWQQLPETVADLYPSPEHLRKRALIEAGYYHEDAIDCGSNAAALRVAAYMRGLDDFALVIVRGPIVLRRTPKSQSYRAMDRKEFQASKCAIMEIIEGLIGAAPGSLEKNAGQAA